MNRLRDIVVRAFRGGDLGADLLLWLAVTVPVFMVHESPEEELYPWPPLPWVKIAAVPLLALAVAVGRRWPVVAAAVPAGLGLTVTPELYTDNFMIAQLLLAFLLGRRTAGMRPGLLFFAGVCLAGLAAAGLISGVTLSDWLSLVETAVATVMLPWLAGRFARRHDDLVRTGWELAERLERERHLIGERMRLVERSRIAGDMHDSLGHELSLVALNAAVLQVHPGLDESARKAAAELRVSAATATERLREIIGVLREDGRAAPVLPSGDTVAALVERAAAAGMAVRLDGELGPLPAMADRAAYRVVQEALTNAVKHAPGAAVTVRLGVDAAAGEAEVTVVNAAPPAGPLPGAGSGGYGLIGLDERVRLAGGTLRARHTGGGFTVTARLPLTAGAPATPPDSRREFALARGKVRRSVIDAIWMPVAAAAAVMALTSGYDLYIAHRSMPDVEVRHQVRVGRSPAVPEFPRVRFRHTALRDGDPGIPWVSPVSGSRFRFREDGR
ncbi:sensor histidine kinase [Rhizohabitans arisaemae]|uniref:sensor histidine kinase n=1 Tax=Rhizohabitans arisaemae TaxID=2720610 RepID=UPI0024B23D6E|nr:histidine kinase [Rhizohabitans arisaemae]